MYNKYNYYIVEFQKNKTGISGLPFTIVTSDDNNNLIFQILRDIEFSFIKSDGDFIKLKIYAIEKGGSSFNKLHSYINGETINSKVVELFSIDEIFTKNANNQWEIIIFNNTTLRFNVFDYKEQYFISNPMFYISSDKLNSMVN